MLPDGTNDKRRIMEDSATQPLGCWKAEFRNLQSKISKNGKIGRLSVIPVGTTSIVIVGHFFGDPKGLNKFRWSRTKIRGTLYWELGVPNHPRNR